MEEGNAWRFLLISLGLLDPRVGLIFETLPPSFPESNPILPANDTVQQQRNAFINQNIGWTAGDDPRTLMYPQAPLLPSLPFTPNAVGLTKTPLNGEENQSDAGGSSYTAQHQRVGHDHATRGLGITLGQSTFSYPFAIQAQQPHQTGITPFAFPEPLAHQHQRHAYPHADQANLMMWTSPDLGGVPVAPTSSSVPQPPSVLTPFTVEQQPTAGPSRPKRSLPDEEDDGYTPPGFEKRPKVDDFRGSKAPRGKRIYAKGRPVKKRRD